MHTNHHHYTPGARPATDNRRYTLWYRGQAIISNVLYPMCNGKKTELLRTGAYTKNQFTIKQA